MGTRSPFKPSRLHWLFRVTIDFLTKAMTSLISPLVCHLTQMGSLAAGPDNNSSGYESEIGWIKHTVHFAANAHYTSWKLFEKGCRVPSLDLVRTGGKKKNRNKEKRRRYLCLRVYKHKQTLPANSPFSSLDSDLICKRWGKNQQIAFRRLFGTKTTMEDGLFSL